MTTEDGWRKVDSCLRRNDERGLIIKDDGLGWAKEFVFYSTPNNGSAKGGRDNKDQHQGRP
jgi:hypothetical protein